MRGGNLHTPSRLSIHRSQARQARQASDLTTIIGYRTSVDTDELLVVDGLFGVTAGDASPEFE